MRKLTALFALVAAALAVALLLRPADPVALLVVEENTVGMGEPFGAAEQQPGHARLEIEETAEGAGARIAPDLLPLRRRTRVLVYKSTSSGFDIVGDSLWQVRTSPFRVPSGGHDRDQDGGPEAEAALQQPAIPDITLERVQHQGALRLRVGATGVELGPGEQWSGAWLIDPEGPQAVLEPAWDQTIRDALSRNTPLIVLRVTHVGWVPRSRILALTEPAALDAVAQGKEGNLWHGGWLGPSFWRWRWRA